jgi:hypothetical protein
MAGGSVLREPGRYASKVVDAVITRGDDVTLPFGEDSDAVIVLNSAGLAADTALTGVIVGTPDTEAIAANSLIISNITADGDIEFVVNDGGNSKTLIFLDGSEGTCNFPLGISVSGNISNGSGTGAFLNVDCGRQVTAGRDIWAEADTTYGYKSGAGGDIQFGYINNDANATLFMVALPHVDEEANNVAVMALVDRDSWSTDLGAGGVDLSGVTSPTLALVAEDGAGYVSFCCTNDDILKINGTTSPVVEADESKMSHKLQVDINGSTYYIMLTAT